jgi:hypothetical protein
MAKKKAVRKASPQASRKKASTKKVLKKKSVAKKARPASSSKSSGAAKKGKAVTESSKPNKKANVSLKKAAVSRKKSTTTKPSPQKSGVTKAKGSVSHTKKGAANTKPGITRTPRPSAPSPTRSAGPKTRVDSLTPTERYNLGGLFACAIERASDPDFRRLRAVLRHLELSSQERENLLRLTQGFMIPKLFAYGVAEDKVSQALTDVMAFALAEGGYEKKWRDEIRQVGRWLGFFPEHVEQIEQQVMAKR